MYVSVKPGGMRSVMGGRIRLALLNRRIVTATVIRLLDKLRPNRSPLIGEHLPTGDLPSGGPLDCGAVHDRDRPLSPSPAAQVRSMRADSFSQSGEPAALL